VAQCVKKLTPIGGITPLARPLQMTPLVYNPGFSAMAIHVPPECSLGVFDGQFDEL